MEMPIRDTTMLEWSKSVFCLMAASMPRGMAMTMDTTAATAASLKVAGTRLNTSSATGRLFT